MLRCAFIALFSAVLAGCAADLAPPSSAECETLRTQYAPHCYNDASDVADACVDWAATEQCANEARAVYACYESAALDGTAPLNCFGDTCWEEEGDHGYCVREVYRQTCAGLLEHAQQCNAFWIPSVIYHPEDCSLFFPQWVMRCAECIREDRFSCDCFNSPECRP